MKTIRRYFLLLPVLIGLAVIATSCDDNDSPEDPILRPPWNSIFKVSGRNGKATR